VCENRTSDNPGKLKICKKLLSTLIMKTLKTKFQRSANKLFLTGLPLNRAGAIGKVANACISVSVEAGSIYFSPKLD